jgi:hypothetical protein
MWKTTTYTIKYKIAYNHILYKVFFFLPSTLAWHMFYLFVNMLRAVLHTLCKSKFLHICIQPYDFFHRGFYVSLKVDIIFFHIWGTQRCFFFFFFLKANCVKFLGNTYFKISSIKIPFLRSLGCKGLTQQCRPRHFVAYEW